ncbi:MAG: helix-turn-helix domain-containing protein [Rhodospirillales bacterium]|jgi:transcriptional regulator with XRE-family HTH domain|nr:helix-turn-helix domain-containing protein [Rhodospirillales bacterium]
MTDVTDVMINRSIGGGLSLARIVRGLSQVELAMATGIAVTRLACLERGETECTARELYAVAQVLGVPVDYFFEGAVAALASTGRETDAPTMAGA